MHHKKVYKLDINKIDDYNNRLRSNINIDLYFVLYFYVLLLYLKSAPFSLIIDALFILKRLNNY